MRVHDFLGRNALTLLSLLAPVVAGSPAPGIPPPLGGAVPRRYDLVLTWEKGAPDGYERDMFKVNGQFPGPLLEFDEGDDVEIYVENKSPYNTTIHYHGIEMLNTPWSDGVPGLSQIPIRPGCAFTYRWTATQHGTYFYHSHSDSQINDGLYGPIVIHPAPGTEKPYSLITSDPLALAAIDQAELERIPLLIGDWRHYTSDREWEISEQSHIEHVCFDSIIVNGKGSVKCLTPEQQAPLITPNQTGLLFGYNLTSKSCVPPEALALLNGAIGLPVAANISAIPPDLFGDCTPTSNPGEVITITKDILAAKGCEPDNHNNNNGKDHLPKRCDSLDDDLDDKWVVFDLIGALSVNTAVISIDEIRSYIVAIDGNYVEPIAADAIWLTNGQRYTILAKFVEPKKYTLRVSGVTDPQILFGTATIDFRVPGKDQSTEPSAPFINERGANVTSDVIIFDGLHSTPFPHGRDVPPREPDVTYKVTMGFGGSINQFVFNATVRPLAASEARPPLLLFPEPGLQDNHTITVPSENAWVDYIMQVPAGQAAHPIHIHGRHFYVLGYGSGEFPWATVTEAMQKIPASFNLENPQLRDTYITPAAQMQAQWLVLRRKSDNPGVWLIHCHIQSHLQGGMSMVIQEGTDQGYAVPEEYRGYQCKAP